MQFSVCLRISVFSCFLCSLKPDMPLIPHPGIMSPAFVCRRWLADTL